MKRRYLVLIVIVAVFAAACGGGESDGTGVASLDGTDTTALETPAGASTDVDEEQALIEFTQCMRDNGVDIGDPTVDAEGNASLDFRGIDVGSLDEEAINVARTACEGYLEGVTLGFDLGDPTELQDMALEFAQCMRDNGYDIDDPDFSGIFTISEDGAPSDGAIRSPFGDVDFEDPAFQAALESCRYVLAGFGGPGAGDPAPTDS
ncbi:MAG: hypothetical protein QNJ88_04625 [Acidimicrobiia bacterium]|nr:hypothetical protein [Acidimicrobiia bacterium]